MQWKKFIVKSGVYVAASVVTAAVTGFLLTALFSLLTGWITSAVKEIGFFIIVAAYFFKEIGLLPLPTLQRKWQIPSAWVNASPVKSMGIWGAILGAGIFTYNPYAIFFLKYMYAGIFHSVAAGLLAGLLFGSSRALTSIVLAYISSKQRENTASVVTVIWDKRTLFHRLHLGALLVLILFTCFLIITAGA